VNDVDNTTNNSNSTGNSETADYSVLDSYRDGEKHKVYDFQELYRYFIYDKSSATPWRVEGYLDYIYYYEDEDFLPIYQDWIAAGYSIDKVDSVIIIPDETIDNSETIVIDTDDVDLPSIDLP
jgi:hypothetical protein